MLQAKTLNGFEMAGDPPKVRVDMCERPIRSDHEKKSVTALRLRLSASFYGGSRAIFRLRYSSKRDNAL
jgi:hypothetical protein